METGKSSVSLVANAERCLYAFQRCLRSAASVHPQEVASAEDQMGRFSLWISSLGVFAKGRASIDHRLSEAPDVREAVAALLESLAYSIDKCKNNSHLLNSRRLERPF